MMLKLYKSASISPYSLGYFPKMLFNPFFLFALRGKKFWRTPNDFFLPDNFFLSKLSIYFVMLRSCDSFHWCAGDHFVPSIEISNFLPSLGRISALKRGDHFPLLSVGEATPGVLYLVLGLPCKRDLDTVEGVQYRAARDDGGPREPLLWRDAQSWDSSASGRIGPWGSLCCFHHIEKSWLSVEVSSDWKRGNIIPAFKWERKTWWTRGTERSCSKSSWKAH